MSSGLTALDIMVLLSLGAGAMFGLLRGFVVELFSLAAWVAGIAAVRLFHAPVAGMLGGPVGTDGGAALLAVALLFGVTFLLVRIAGGTLGTRLRGTVLGPVDRALGLGFGVLKGLIAATLAFLLMSLVYDTINGARSARPDWMVKSRSWPLLRVSSNAIVSFVESRRTAKPERAAPPAR